MAAKEFKYVIVGAGTTGGSAVEGIREVDKDGAIALIGMESHLPYNRPPLSKKLWWGKKKVESIFLHDEKYYADNNVSVILGTKVIGIGAAQKTITDNRGEQYRYQKLLLATGGRPRTLGIPGGDAAGICYYRYLDDFVRLWGEVKTAASATVIGGGFIGTELAAALQYNKLKVTMVFPGPRVCQRVFPESLARAVEKTYLDKGIDILSGDEAMSIEKAGGKFITHTRQGMKIESDMLVVGVGIDPCLDLALAADLAVDNGIVVDDHLASANPDIYAAGDNASFPYQALGKRTRVEHWDAAVTQGKLAGRNMAGADESYTHMPYFFSDLFDFGYEAVGEIDSSLQIVTDWKEENKTGVIYYLRDGVVRGAMMCNVWDKVPAASELIRQGKKAVAADLHAAIA